MLGMRMKEFSMTVKRIEAVAFGIGMVSSIFILIAAMVGAACFKSCRQYSDGALWVMAVGDVVFGVSMLIACVAMGIIVNRLGRIAP